MPTLSARSRVALQVAGFAAMVGLLASCEIFNPAPAADDLTPLLQNSEALWAAQGIHDYQFDYQHACVCGGDSAAAVHVVVINDTISSVFLQSDTLPPSVPKSVFHTVPGMFTVIQNALNSGNYVVQAAFDGTLGVPLDVQMTLRSNLSAASDVYTLYNFVKDP